ncbi:MAG: LysR family transcriptional regulator [Sphingopyxis sp.]|uniref:LysR family transcriptional regulator n=1 Tax=Sphingopyxis sp. TaxID=1908224 RepID=UPI002ABA3366|nr:LysR family transcriptional regulator [Sphingopyxis sp.]MDZ3832297.1 LysR family transcriptional regulator [Sphingopyxis sp.]
MKLRQIEIFHAVYLTGSVSAAARVLNISQPSVTKILHYAESSLGLTLFDRTRGRLVPTEDAHELFSEVAEIQKRVDLLQQASRNLRFGRGRTLRISVLPSLGLGAIPDAVSEFLAKHEGVSLELHTAHHDDMVRKLYERETDLVITYDVPATAPVAYKWLGKGEMVAVYRDGDIECDAARLPLSTFKGRRFITTVKSGPMGRLLSEELNRAGVVPQEVVSSQTYFVAVALVRSGVGVSVVDSFTAQAASAPGVLFKPLSPALGFNVHAIYLQNRPLSKLATVFLKHLKDAFEAYRLPL